MRDIWREIAIEYLKIKDILCLCKVNREFYQIFSHEILWKQLWNREMSSVAIENPKDRFRAIAREIKAIRDGYIRKVYRMYKLETMIDIYYAKHGLDRKLQPYENLRYARGIIEKASSYGQWHIIRDMLANKNIKHSYIIDNWKEILIMKGAAKNGNEQIVEEMLTLGADNYDECLIQASKKGHMKIVERMLSLDINKQIIASNAVKHNDIQVIEKMLSLGAKDYDSVLLEACRYAKTDIIDRILPLVGGKQPYKYPLYWAASEGHLDICERLIKLGAKNFNDLLVSAARGGHMVIVDRAISLGAKDYTKAMVGAAEFGHKDIVKKMLDLGVKSYAQGIREATNYGYTDIAELIKSYKWKR